MCTYISNHVRILDNRKSVFSRHITKRGVTMTLSEAQKKANTKYRKENIKRIPLDVQNEKYDQIKAAATAAGETVNGFIKRAIDERLDRETGVNLS